jgi:hypothetical protein
MGLLPDPKGPTNPYSRTLSRSQWSQRQTAIYAHGSRQGTVAIQNDVASKSGYAIEPTGLDAGNKNGKVERTNGTFGATGC